MRYQAAGIMLASLYSIVHDWCVHIDGQDSQVIA